MIARGDSPNPAHWLENHGGSPLRQQWIERLEELGLLDSPVAAAD